MSRPNPTDILAQGAGQLGIRLDARQTWMFETYTSLLLDWNRRINLTAITDPAEIAVKHYLDSLACLSTVIPERAAVIDVGTGAGFPGLPLKIVRQDLDLTLLDATHKKLLFLDAVCSELGFLDVQLVHGRAEEAGRDVAYREKYDVVLSRAVTTMNALAEYCLPFAKVGGMFLAQKGPDVEQELEGSRGAVETLGGRIERIAEMVVPMSDYRRTLVVVRKAVPTPAQYPRSQAEIGKRAL